MRRLLALLVLLAIAVPAPVAFAQSSGGGAFGPLPQAQPAETPTPEPNDTNGGFTDISRETLFIIAAGVILAFVVLGTMITRDARRKLTEEDRAALDGTRAAGTAPRKQDLAKIKARQRAKDRAQRQARKKTRRAGRR
jgi:hypothetical protein